MVETLLTASICYPFRRRIHQRSRGEVDGFRLRVSLRMDAAEASSQNPMRSKMGFLSSRFSIDIGGIVSAVLRKLLTFDCLELETNGQPNDQVENIALVHEEHRRQAPTQRMMDIRRFRQFRPRKPAW